MAGEDATAPLAKAEMCFQRLVALQDKNENRYLLAMCLDVKKQPGVVLELLKGMAPADKVGYGQAHLHMAELYMTGKLAPPPGSSPGLAAENHLRRAEMTRNSASRARMLLYDLYRQWNKKEEAEKSRIDPSNT